MRIQQSFLTGPSQQGLKFASPPKRQAPELVDQDRVELSQAHAKEAKPSFLRRLASFGLKALSLAGTLGGVGVGVGVATNYEVVQEAMHQEKTVYGYAHDIKSEQIDLEVAPHFVEVNRGDGDISRLQKHLQVTTTPHSISATLQNDKAQAVLTTVLNSDKVQTALQRELTELETKVNHKLSDIRIKPGEALLEASIPFPTGEGSLLQVAGENIPVGVRKLKLEEVPLVLKHQFDPFNTGLKVDFEPMQVDRAPLPEGEETALHLLSASARADHQDLTKTEFSGSIRLEFDDGSATRRALEKTQDPARRAALQERLQRIERIQSAIEDQQLEGILDFALGQRELAFRGNLGGDGEGMGKARVHAWLTPDSDGDGRADVRLSAEIETPGLAVVEFTPTSMEHAATRESGWRGRLQDEIAERMEQKAFEVAPQALDGLRGTIDEAVRKVLMSELDKGEIVLDDLLDGTLDVLNESTNGVGLDFSRLDVDAETGDLRASARSRNGTLKETLGPRATVRKQVDAELEVVAPEPLFMAPISNPEGTVVRVNSNDPSILVPGSSARRFLNSVLNNPETQEAFEQLTLGPRNQITEKAAALPSLDGSLYVDVEIPFPGAESLKSPLGPIPTLVHKNVPVRADYSVNEFGLEVELDTRLVEVEEAARPEAAAENGVFVGAISVATQPMKVDLQGSVTVNKEKTEGGAAWAESALEEAFQNQNFQFETEVSLGKTEAMFYVWLTPDSNGDGHADVAIGHRTLSTGADDVSVSVHSVESDQGTLDLSTRLGGRLNGIVHEIASNQIANSGKSLQAAISKLLESRVDGLLGEGSEKVAEAVNSKLPGFYRQLENIEVKLPEQLTPEGSLNLGLRALEVKGDSLIVNYGDDRVRELLSGAENPTISSRVAEDGELLVQVPGELFNRLVRDQREGGPMDWDQLLGEAVDGSGVVKRLKLATNRDGEPISPELKLIDGRPFLSLAVDGQTNGLATPVTAGARKLPGFLGDGLGWLTENTAGAVLGSRLRTEVQVPLEFTIQDGALHLSAGDVQFAKPAEKGKRSLADYVPTRALSGVITRGLANHFGPKVLDKMLSEITPTVDAGEIGIDWSRVEVKAGENGSPVITVGVQANEAMPALLLGSQK